MNSIYKQLYPNGEITKEQFQRLYNELFPNALCDDEYATNIFSAFDDNLSGTICFTEFLIAISISGKADHTEKLRLAFKMYDNNKNGQLEMNEISQILEGIRHLTNHDEDGEPVDLMDWDSNGSGTLTEEEFIKFVEAHPKVNKHLTDLFKLNGH